MFEVATTVKSMDGRPILIMQNRIPNPYFLELKQWEIKEFQRYHGLLVDGCIGFETSTKMKEVLLGWDR